MATSSTATDRSINNDSYTKNCVLSVEKYGHSIKFFNNEIFRAHFQQHLSNAYSLKCCLRSTDSQDIDIELMGTKQNVKDARDNIKKLFECVQEKIFNREDTDQKMIYWSQHIISDSVVPIIEEIMNKEKIFALWDKTAMFSGYLKAIYFTHEPYTTTAEKITDILTREIGYIADLGMPKENTKNFLTTIDDFIVTQQHPEFAFIQCRYAFKTDFKISLFGRKNLLKKIKRQLQSLIQKHTVQIYRLKLKDSQQEYLLDHCCEQIQNIEDDYKDDHVKIRIRLKEFSASQYVAEKVKQKITDLILYTTICRFSKMSTEIIFTDDQRTHIYQIARKNYCRIEKIDNQTDWIVCPIPKAFSSSSATSNLTVQRSNEFCSGLSMKKISILQSSIEIYLTDQITSIPRDVTIISSDAGAIEEQTEYRSDNGYVEEKSGRKFFFYLWSPVLSNDEKQNKKFRRSIEKFISSTLQSVVNCCPQATRIAFSTSNWENMETEQQKQFVEILINEIKRDIESRNSKWRILFLFNHQQKNLYTEFSRLMTKLQTYEDGFAQISCPISTMLITLTTSSNDDLRRCEHEINDYVEKHIISNQSVNLQFDLRRWNQHMINSFYSYCLTKSVLPRLTLKDDVQLQLIGSILDVEKVTAKCQLMCDISDELTSTNQNQSSSTGYNIYFSYCRSNQSTCHQLFNCLTNEGYSICRKSSKKPLSTPDIEKSDVFLVVFTEEFSKDLDCIAAYNHAKSIKKTLIPLVIRQRNQDNEWLSSLTLATLFYDLFECEIDLEFIDDFDLEYDQLLSTLLRYTKPGITGQPYPAKRIVNKPQNENEHYQEIIFGQKSAALQKITPEQNRQLQLVYQQELQKKIEVKKIPSDEIDDLVVSLTVIVDDIKTLLAGHENDYSEIRPHWPLDKSCQIALNDFLYCVKRWLEKAPNVIKGNFPPFSPTGDINDALFTIHQTSQGDSNQRTYELIDCSPSSMYFSVLPSDLGCSFNDEQADEYYARLLRKTKPKNEMDMKIEKNSVVWECQSVDQLKIGDALKTAEDIRKIEERDNPNRIWTKTRGAKAFIEQKIKNIREFQDLCERFK
ncbi:unnamed protein product [Adineta steineri]|uniref:TIR domain-containing protein n=1 Tax=Adineta steineri TaxID=433720 RepID=A0A819NNQ1_9BILA|nr:unnamed protein product [Adineta steineri]CAF3999417.1 unnamed protein product [Adineta steineri]